MCLDRTESVTPRPARTVVKSTVESIAQIWSRFGACTISSKRGAALIGLPAGGSEHFVRPSPERDCEGHGERACREERATCPAIKIEPAGDRDQLDGD
jgi:hypothetical protein